MVKKCTTHFSDISDISVISVEVWKPPYLAKPSFVFKYTGGQISGPKSGVLVFKKVLFRGCQTPASLLIRFLVQSPWMTGKVSKVAEIGISVTFAGLADLPYSSPNSGPGFAGFPDKTG